MEINLCKCCKKVYTSSHYCQPCYDYMTDKIANGHIVYNPSLYYRAPGIDAKSALVANTAIALMLKEA